MAASIALIIILGLGAELLFRKLRLPGLVGMLIVGVIIGPYVLDVMNQDMMHVSADFRKIALVVILLRAGFELNRNTLKRVGRSALLMSSIPAVFEIGAVVLAGPHLFDISYTEAAMLGAILGAVSPAVVVPIMIDFMDRGRGSKKGIPTLILGASSVDDVFVIVLFTIFLDMYGGNNVNIALKLAEVPESIMLGIIVGLIPGYFFYRLFHKYDWRPPKRTLAILGMAILLTWMEGEVEDWVPVASLLGVMAMGFIILEKSEPIAHIVSQELKKLWVAAELFLFVLVGAQVDIHVAWDAGLAGTLLIVIGLSARSVGTYLTVLGNGFTQKEKLFCVVSYIPKATVQAAIGAVPLEAGVAHGDLILAVAVLSILITAPLGAIGILAMGERVLDHGEKHPAYRFRKLRESMALPRVGERVRHKSDDTQWKVIEEREIWAQHPESTELVPVIEIRYWHEGGEPAQGKGKTKTERYRLESIPFQNRWEILYDW